MGPKCRAAIAAGTDPMRMTLYGEIYLHLVSMDETVYMQPSQPCTPVDLIGRECHLKHSLCQLLRSEQCHALGIDISSQQEIHQLRYNVLGHCLSRLGHHGEARIAFEQQIDYFEIKHSVTCERCEESIRGSRFVCYSCKDVDLCQSCVKCYSSDAPKTVI